MSSQRNLQSEARFWESEASESVTGMATICLCSSSGELDDATKRKSIPSLADFEVVEEACGTFSVSLKVSGSGCPRLTARAGQA